MRKKEKPKLNIEYSTLINVVTKAFGQGSYTAGFVKRIIETDSSSIPTIAINNKGIVIVNREFWTKNITSDSDIFTVVLHEFFHGLFLHTTEKTFDAIRNLATDAVINSIIYHTQSSACNDGSFFKKFYLKKEALEKAPIVQAILSPGAHKILEGSPFEALYDRLYPANPIGHQPPTSQVVEEILRSLLPEEPKTIILLGGHGGCGSGKPIEIGKNDKVIVIGDDQDNDGEEDNGNGGGGEGVDKSEDSDTDEEGGDNDKLRRDQIQEIAENIRQICGGKGCGKGNGFIDMLLKLIEDNFKDDIKKYVLRMIEKKAITKMKRDLQPPRQILNPVPVKLSRKDVVSICRGQQPLYYRYDRRKDNYGKLIIYLDVSGSIVSRAGEIVSWLKRNEFERKVEKIYTFSTQVAEATMDELKEGKIKTDYGTDFDSVAIHMNTLPYTRYIVFTDGECSMKECNVKLLKDKAVSILSVLVEGERLNSCPGFGEVGSTVHLETR